MRVVITNATGDLGFLPLCTPGAVLAVQRRRELASLCRTNTPDTEAFLAAYDKRLCMEQCSR
jgi:hypothetical protein